MEVMRKKEKAKKKERGRKGGGRRSRHQGCSKGIIIYNEYQCKRRLVTVHVRASELQIKVIEQFFARRLKTATAVTMSMMIALA